MTTVHCQVAVREQLRTFLRDNFLYLRPELELDDDDDLLELGVLDSMALVELVEEVQDRFGVAVADAEITEENFGSVGGIVRLVLSRQAG